MQLMEGHVLGGESKLESQAVSIYKAQLSITGAMPRRTVVSNNKPFSGYFLRDARVLQLSLERR